MCNSCKSVTSKSLYINRAHQDNTTAIQQTNKQHNGQTDNTNRQTDRQTDSIQLFTHVWALTGSGGVIPYLSLIVVPPGVHPAVRGAGQTVQGATGNVHHPPLRQGTQHPLGGALVGVVAMTQSVVISFTPEKERAELIFQFHHPTH